MGNLNCCERKNETEDDLLTFFNNRDTARSSIKLYDSEVAVNTTINAELENLPIDSDLLVSAWKGTPLDKYKAVKRIGVGTYAKVYLVAHKETKIQRAMKEIGYNSIEKQKMINNEIEIIKKLDYPHIVKIYEYFQKGSNYYLLTEFCEDGDLFQKISNNFFFGEEHICSIMFQLLLSIYYCHINNIVHRDLKPENIMVTGIDEKGHFNIKIIDFGVAKNFKTKEFNEPIGSAYYIAPEVLKKKYNEKCDLWSIGVILYVLIAKEPPFKGKKLDQVFNEVLNSKPNFNNSAFSKVSNNGTDLLLKLLEKDPEKRLSAIDSLNHPWFKQFKLDSTISQKRLSLFINNLKSYKTDYKLQQAAIAVIVHNMPSNHEIKEIERAFRIIDLNGDGKLNKDELVKGFIKIFNQTVDQTTERIDQIFRSVDADKNGFIQYEEFIRACIPKEVLLSDNNVRFAFNFFDLDQSGHITVTEIEEVFCSGNKNISKAVIEKIISQVDLDGDNQVSFDEFKIMMNKIIN